MKYSQQQPRAERGPDGGRIEASDWAVYAELQPMDRHRPLIDHLFILRDRGRLTGIGRHLFASPFSEMALVGRPAHDENGGALAWKAFHLPPRFGRQSRQRSFHGWMFGIRYRPLDLDTDEAALAGLSELFNARGEGVREHPFDPIIGALDAWIEHYLGPRRSPAAASAKALDDALSAAGPDRGIRVASLAATAGVVPRTLQRHFRKRTGLAPKRYAAVQRFSGALQQVASGDGSLADIASEAGYCDQAHLTADWARHAGLSPGRFRALARQQIARDAVRFFKDAGLRKRVRLLVCDSGAADDGETHGEIQSEGRKLRDARPHQLRASNRDGHAGH
jgi:AraC-like DNA-binding protein